jgi:hypothetical protein
VPKRAQKMTKKSGAQEIRFLGQIGFLKPFLEKFLLKKQTEFIQSGLEISAFVY